MITERKWVQGTQPQLRQLLIPSLLHPFCKRSDMHGNVLWMVVWIHYQQHMDLNGISRYRPSPPWTRASVWSACSDLLLEINFNLSVSRGPLCYNLPMAVCYLDLQMAAIHWRYFILNRQCNYDSCTVHYLTLILCFFLSVLPLRYICKSTVKMWFTLTVTAFFKIRPLIKIISSAHPLQYSSTVSRGPLLRTWTSF